jgi:hypothetical protein
MGEGEGGGEEKVFGKARLYETKRQAGSGMGEETKKRTNRRQTR